MEVYKTPSKDVQEIILANVTYKEVIEGLNGYFASEPRNDYITVKMESDKQNFALYEAEAWADILISWLRTEHEIFYYPGMEAKYAKMERIPPFTERMMDEGALNSLKALYKRVIGQAVGINSHTLIADSIKFAVNGKESAIEKMKERIAELESNFKAVCDEDDIFRTRALKAEEEAKKLKEQLEKTTGKQMVDKYEKDLLRFIYKEYKGRTHLSDETVTYDPPSVRNTVLKIISDYARSRTRVDILETRIKSIFDRCKAKFTVDDYVLNGDPTTSFMLDCISSWIDSPAPRDGWTNREIENLRGQISRLKDLINAMNEEVEDM